jgi:hypothetical protein
VVLGSFAVDRDGNQPRPTSRRYERVRLAIGRGFSKGGTRDEIAGLSLCDDAVDR